MFKITEIAPGVRLVSVKTDKYKTAEINVAMALPMDEKAAANALLIKLLRRSCKAYPDFIEFNNRLAELYGASVSASVSKIGDAQVLSLHGSCLDDRFALDGEALTKEFVSLLTSLIFSPNVSGNSFGADNLAREKRLTIEEIREELDDKRVYAYKKCIEYMCENEPYGKPEKGTIEEVEKVKMNEVYAAWKRLLSTAIIQITAVGSVDDKEITKIFKTKLKKIDRQPCEIETIFLKKPQRFQRHEEKMLANQGKLVIGYRTGMENSKDNYYAEAVMADIFGGGTYSKLFTNIREKQSLAYYCSARLIASKGIVVVQSGIDSDKEKPVSAGIIKQLNEVRAGRFDDETLSASKKSIKESLTLVSPDVICSFYASQILEKEVLSPEDMAAGIENVTKEEICAAASTMVLDKIFMLFAEPGEVDA